MKTPGRLTKRLRCWQVNLRANQRIAILGLQGRIPMEASVLPDGMTGGFQLRRAGTEAASVGLGRGR